MNYMSEVAKMLGVELGEEFRLKGLVIHINLLIVDLFVLMFLMQKQIHMTIC